MDRSARMLRVLALGLVLAAAGATRAAAHAMPENASPAAGAVLESAPKLVWIVFDTDLARGSCELRVEDDQGRAVSQGPARVDPRNARLLEVLLKPLAPGTYRVLWVVVSQDGHSTQGDYAFTVSG